MSGISSYIEQILEKLDELPLPRWAWLIIFASVVALLLVVLCICICRTCACCVKVRSFLGKWCWKCLKVCKKYCCCCCAPGPGDHLDLNAICLTGPTMYERVHPSVDEYEYSNRDPFDDMNQGIRLGQVKFSLEYHNEDEVLEVTIYEAKNLPSADEDGGSDPYIRVMLLPDTKRRYETTVLDNTLDPVYDQTFTFTRLPYSELQNRTLCIRALDYDEMPGHDILGETLIPMIDINIAERFEEWRILVPGYDEDNPGEFRKAVSEYGDICVGMHYMPATKTLTVYVIECQNLKPVDEGDGDTAPTSDPFVKVTMIRNKKKVKTHKTRHIKQTLRPYYNEQFRFTLNPQDVPVTDVRLLVLDYDIFGGADVIGQTLIGASAYGPQMRHWRDMLLSPKRPITCWHMLRAKPAQGEED